MMITNRMTVKKVTAFWIHVRVTGFFIPFRPILHASRWTMYTSAMYEMMAGRKACLMTSTYEIPTYSTIRNAAAPITGGVNCPLVEAATSTAPAFSAENPTFFIKGIVNVPVVTTLAIDEPDTRPVNPDDTTAALAGPPRKWPSPAKAVRIK